MFKQFRFFSIFLVRTDFHYSELTISQASKEHSGNYTCVPSNSQPASVVVHIFKGDNPAAMYHEHRSSSTIPYRDRSEMLRLLGFLMVLLLVVRYWRETDLTVDGTAVRPVMAAQSSTRCRAEQLVGSLMRDSRPAGGRPGRVDVSPDRRTRTDHVQIYTNADNHQPPPQEL
uniref:Ig-like domain-containing protein n=1 Tax=Anopheles maculatus TaxID=74869 RepID=A0A182SE97_9DIPT